MKGYMNIAPLLSAISVCVITMGPAISDASQNDLLPTSPGGEAHQIYSDDKFPIIDTSPSTHAQVEDDGDIPIPAPLALCGFGLIGLAGFSNRKTKEMCKNFME